MINSFLKILTSIQIVEECLHYSISAGGNSGHVYVLLRVLKYLKKDNPCPNTFFLLLTGKMRMKEKAILC